MPERIYKLQPDRTVHLRGFDHLGASAAVHSATPNGFTVSGNFRDAADFAVVVLYDADNFFEHPRLKYLPDFNFNGLTLTFDVNYQNLMPLNSRKYASIDWPYLDVVSQSGGSARFRLSDYATVIANPDQPASAQFEIAGEQLDAWDRVTLWYQNMAFDYIVPGKVRTEYAFYAQGPGHQHSILVRDRAYTYTEAEGDSSAAIAAHLIGQVNGQVAGTPADPEVAASVGADAWVVRLERLLDTGATVPVSASGNISEVLYHVKATTACRALCEQMNGTAYGQSAPFGLSAEAVGTTLRITTTEGGYDANFLSMYCVSKNSRLTASPAAAKFAGGASTVTLRVTLDFAALGCPDIRRMWLTLAPRLEDGRDYEGAEWKAVFSNWTLAGPEEVKRLQVAGPGSVLVEALDERCATSGAWTLEEGFYLGNHALVAMQAGAEATVRYYCAQPHEVWVWTSLYGDRGPSAVELDGALLAALDPATPSDTAIITRRRVAAGVAAGDHVLRLTALGPGPFYFIGAEAVVPGDVPDPLPAQTQVTPALDYSTDHTYKLPPARILWMLDQLGCKGPLNEYIGILWWNERKRVDGVAPELRIEFSGQFEPGDQVFLTIGGQTLGKSLLLPEPAEQVARHFAMIVNATLVGVWARVEGAALVLRARSAAPAYSYPVSVVVEQAAGSAGAATGGGTLGGGSMGTWEIDEAAARTVNFGAREWHSDFYNLCAAAGREVLTAMSMELVNPPASLAARYADGNPVLTDMGFGGLRSTHCAFSPGMLAYQQRAFLEVADLMAAQGLTPELQCGEFTWWYFTNHSTSNPLGGMAYYDADTAAAAQAALGRPLELFRSPGDDPMVNGGADASFLRARLRDYAAGLTAHVRASHPAARFEVLFPYDVNHPEPAGIHALGGRLNRFVNLPAEWGTKGLSGFDRFKVEALDFGVWSRNLDLARECLEFPLLLGWQADSVRAMIGVFRGGYPWRREVEYAKDLGMANVSLWAFDHVCLFGLELAAAGAGRAQLQG